MKVTISVLILLSTHVMAQELSDKETAKGLAPQEQVEAERRQQKMEEEKQEAAAIKPGPYDKDGNYKYELPKKDDQNSNAGQ